MSSTKFQAPSYRIEYCFWVFVWIHVEFLSFCLNWWTILWTMPYLENRKLYIFFFWLSFSDNVCSKYNKNTVFLFLLKIAQLQKCIEIYNCSFKQKSTMTYIYVLGHWDDNFCSRADIRNCISVRCCSLEQNGLLLKERVKDIDWNFLWCWKFCWFIRIW